MKFTVNTMAFGQDDYFYSATFEPTEIVKWNLVKGTSEVAFTADYTAVLRFSQNGQYVIFPNSDDSWCYFNCAYDIWDLNNKKLISNLTLGFLTVFDTDRNQLATSMFSGVSQETPILIIDMQSGEERTEINGGTNINFLSFSPQGKYILIVGKALMNGPYHLHIWDIITNTKVLDTEFQEKFINATFSPDEESVLIATSNPSSILWDLTNGKSEQYFTHDDQVQWASMSEDGMYIVSAGLDHTIRVWSVINGTEIIRFHENENVKWVDFSQDLRKIIVITDSGKVKFYYWQDNDLIGEACTLVTRNLTLSEWQQYIPNESYQQTCIQLPSGN